MRRHHTDSRKNLKQGELPLSSKAFADVPLYGKTLKLSMV